MDEHDGSISSSSASESSTSSSSTSGLQVSGMDDAQESDVETYEGVSQDSFSDYVEYVTAACDAQIAASVVMVFTLMLCAGILAVDTLMRSMEGR